MSQLGPKCKVYYQTNCIGRMRIVDVQGKNFRFPNDEIVIDRFSPNCILCKPHSVAHYIGSSSVVCKLEAGDERSELFRLYMSCITQLKTGVVLLGKEEVHLVAMVKKYKNCACFWCYAFPPDFYSVCLRMLDLRCLWIVLDLDETLIVGNTMRSFKDKIASLRRRITRETDPVRKSEIYSEIVLYEEDQRLLKQYIDRDSVVENGKVYNVQAEVVTLCESQKRIVRPVIRLLDRSMVLTRINPEVRDTSVLVRLRPGWEDFRNHLHSKKRKRFEVYICTMAERNYALEMWRLLDPEAHLIDPEQISARVVCVKSGSRKSLHSVFQDKKFHSEMAMVIDDRLKVWEDVDQPRVQVVPAFSPYSAPQAEIGNVVPVLCVARNVACNVRNWFFKEFDKNLSDTVSRLFYEDEVKNLPSPPNVSTYFMPEGGWLVDGQRCDLSGPDRQHTRQISLGQSTVGAVSVGLSSHGMESKSKEARERFESDQQNLSEGSHLSGTGKEELLPPSMYVKKLEEIGKRCHLEVGYKFSVGTGNNLQFSAEVFFGCRKVGAGRGKTEKDAQQKAAEDALQKLANGYVSYLEFN